MTTISLESIKAAHEHVADLIAKFESAAARTVAIPQSNVVLAIGEKYAGIALTESGAPSHHLILVQGEATDIDWSSAMGWAKSVGGELPTRQEQALLYANLKTQFEPRYYWSSEQHAGHSVCAWGQDFGIGYQGDYRKSLQGRARAVRRLSI